MTTVSIITAVFNAVGTIETAIQSLLKQDVDVEHIVIDGGSTDGTRDVLTKYETQMAKLVTEPDEGIYDALNKGITLATGDVVGVLHADDMFAAPDVLHTVADAFAQTSVQACYGDLLYVDVSNTDNVKRYWQSNPFLKRRFRWGWMPPHPTFFVRREVFSKFGSYRMDLGSAADYELMLRFLLKHSITCKYIPKIITKMRVGGTSNASLGNRLRANRNDRRAWKANGLRPYPWT